MERNPWAASGKITSESADLPLFPGRDTGDSGPVPAVERIALGFILFGDVGDARPGIERDRLGRQMR
jgi:hypothetical protein